MDSDQANDSLYTDSLIQKWTSFNKEKDMGAANTLTPGYWQSLLNQDFGLTTDPMYGENVPTPSVATANKDIQGFADTTDPMYGANVLGPSVVTSDKQIEDVAVTTDPMYGESVWVASVVTADNQIQDIAVTTDSMYAENVVVTADNLIQGIVFDQATNEYTLQFLKLDNNNLDVVTESSEHETQSAVFQPASPALTGNLADIPLDASDEAILQFLESKGGEIVAPKLTLNESVDTKREDAPVKCKYCGLLFTFHNFKEHICDYDKNHNLIMPNTSNTIEPKTFPGMFKTPELPKKLQQKQKVVQLDPPCIRLMRENQVRIRRFLKDELKYDSHLTMKVAAPITTSPTKNAEAATAAADGSSTKKYSHVCSMCDRGFVHASGLLRHMERHALDLIPGTQSTSRTAGPVNHNAAKYAYSLRVMIKCRLCGRVFFQPKTAHQHYCDDHYNNKPMPHLETSDAVDSELPYDMWVDEGIQLLQNELSNSWILTENGLKQCEKYPLPPTMEIIMLSCVLQCEFCDYIFSDVSYLLLHSACHSVSRRYECFACGIHARTSKEICTHWQAECVFMRENMKLNNANALRYFVCNVCEDKFQGLDQLMEHRYTAFHLFPRFNESMTALQLPCEQCDTVSHSAQEAMDHFLNKHAKKNRKGKEGGTSSTSAPKTRQYLCDICGKSYTQSSHLWQHLRFHQGVKPFACKEPGCNRKFTIRPDLNDHIRKCHTGERPYHCLVCGKRFLTGSVFYQHRLIHRGERRYECDQCNKRFYRADALKNHQRIHTGEKPYGCTFCTKHFRQRGDRDKHVRARHSCLDENARVMMQMQKLKLETEAAAAEALRRGEGETEIANVVGQNAQLLMLGDPGIAKNFFDNIQQMAGAESANADALDWP